MHQRMGFMVRYHDRFRLVQNRALLSHMKYATHSHFILHTLYGIWAAVCEDKGQTQFLHPCQWKCDSCSRCCPLLSPGWSEFCLAALMEGQLS